MTTMNSINLPTGLLNTVVLGQGIGSAFASSTATYPPTTTINQLLYSSAANTITGLTTANNGLLITSNAGAPSILAGPGTTGNILQANAAAAPSFSTSTYPSTNAINTLLYASAANVMSALATANSASLVTTSAGVPGWSGTMTNGQIIIGSTGATPTAATITAGTNITVTNAAGSITIAASGMAGFTWTTVTGATQNLASFNGYVANRATSITFSVPASAAVGDQYIIEGLGAGLSIIQMNGGQTCNFGSAATTAGGTLTATNQFDAITLTCTVANTTFNARGLGNWTLA